MSTDNPGYGSFIYRQQQYGDQLYEWGNDNPFSSSASLPQYVACHDLRERLLSLVSKISTFNHICELPYKYIANELLDFIPLSDFDTKLNALRENASQFTLQFGEGLLTSDTDYIARFKRVYIESDYIQNNAQLNRQLGLSTPEDINKLKTIPQTYVSGNAKSMLSGVVEKIASNFRFSEFIIGVNLAIIEFNHRMLNVTNVLSEIYELNSYLESKCPHTADHTTEYMATLSDALHDTFMNSEGVIDYDSLLSGLTTEQKTNVRNVVKVVRLILNTSLNEIKIKCKISNFYLTDINVPSKYIPPTTLPDPDTDPLSISNPSNLTITFEVP